MIVLDSIAQPIQAGVVLAECRYKLLKQLIFSWRKPVGHLPPAV